MVGELAQKRGNRMHDNIIHSSTGRTSESMIMKRFLSILSATVLLGYAPAMAADLEIEPAPMEQTPVEFGSGWYLRGDIGITTHTDTDVDYHYDQSVDETWTIGGGVGYHFNEYLRADVTVDYAGGHEWGGKLAVETLDGDIILRNSADIDRTTWMLNGYVSLGQYGGFKPYIGGGVGLSHIWWSNISSEPSGVLEEVDDQSDTVVTYALMAGLDYSFNEYWTVDFGYRWLKMHDGTIFEDAPLLGGGDLDFTDTTTQEFKIGLRYDIW